MTVEGETLEFTMRNSFMFCFGPIRYFKKEMWSVPKWINEGNTFILTQRLGTRLERLTCRGANMWSCWRQDIAAAWTRESEWSWVIAQPTKQDERIVEIVAPFPSRKKYG